MGLSPEGFLKRLRRGRTVNCTYRTGNLTGLISSWTHEGRFVLTWEECRLGDQYNEHVYTRDDRLSFESAEEVLAFAERSGYPATAFMA